MSTAGNAIFNGKVSAAGGQTVAAVEERITLPALIDSINNVVIPDCKDEIAGGRLGKNH